MATYNISEMEEALENASSIDLSDIRGTFKEFFEKISKNNFKSEILKQNSLIEIYDLTDHASHENVFYGQGLYVIFTNHEVVENKCTLRLDEEVVAIYRGECFTVKRRIESHLFNEKYQNSYEKRKTEKLSAGKKFSEPFYGACIKVDPQKSGINIDKPEYSSSKWKVLVLKMSGSSSPIRKQAELAFDDVFTKPIASRD